MMRLVRDKKKPVELYFHIGDTAYRILSKTSLVEETVSEIIINNTGINYITSLSTVFSDYDVGKTVFITKESALLEMSAKGDRYV